MSFPTFTYFWVLAFLLLPALVLIWVWMRSARRVVFPLDHGRQGKGIIFHILLNVAASLPALLLAVIIFILAVPQQMSEPKTKRRLTNIQFCVDVSGSMISRFGEGTRYDASMAAINQFLDYRDGDAFGLTFFGNLFVHWTPLTSDSSAIRCSIPFMRPEVAPPGFGGTEIGKALMACKDVLATREEGDRMIILVTDGYSFDLQNGTDVELARTFKNYGITVYAIHVGGGQIPDPIVNVTSLTGGEVFDPGDPEALKAVFHRIDSMQKAPLEKTKAETMDNFFPWCVAGLVLLGMIGFSMFGLRYTPW